MPAVEVSNVHKSFGSVHAVAGATWSATAGEVTAVLGPNGAGKTTTIACLEGMLHPDSGDVRVLGADPWRAGPDHRARVGVMLQDGGLPTTAHPIALLRHLARMYAAPRPVDELVDRLDLSGLHGTSVRRLSGGQRQRVALAAALVGAPDVVFLDEPTAGLDPHARLDTWDLIREVAVQGACVVLTTHSFEEAERLADRVVIMARGVVLADGTVGQVSGEGSLERTYFALTGRGAA